MGGRALSAFRGRPLFDEDDDDVTLPALGACMEAEYQAVVIRWAQAWFKVKEAEAKAARDAERKRKSGNKFRSSR